MFIESHEGTQFFNTDHIQYIRQAFRDDNGYWRVYMQGREGYVGMVTEETMQRVLRMQDPGHMIFAGGDSTAEEDE